jgi:hypothetical protein
MCNSYYQEGRIVLNQSYPKKSIYAYDIDENGNQSCKQHLINFLTRNRGTLLGIKEEERRFNVDIRVDTYVTSCCTVSQEPERRQHFLEQEVFSLAQTIYR